LPTREDPHPSQDETLVHGIKKNQFMTKS